MSSTKLSAILPFIVALIFYLIAPLLAKKAKTVLTGQIARDAGLFKTTTETPVPPWLSSEMISDYVDYIADVVQIIPATLLPVLGAVFALSTKFAVNVAVVVLIVAIISAITMDAIVLSLSAADYVSRKWLGYSLIGGIGIVINLAALTFILIYS